MLTKDLTIVVGGILPEINSNARPDRRVFIAEAEKVIIFLYMKPKYSIITNIEEDHLESSRKFRKFKEVFYSIYKSYSRRSYCSYRLS